MAPVACLTCTMLAGVLAGCSGAPDEGEETTRPAADTPSSTNSTAEPLAEQTTCPSFSATLDQHVASGRATVQTSNFTVFTVSSYTAVGTGELLGVSGSQQVVLYQIGPASYSADATKCAAANVAPVPRLLPTATNCPTFTGNGIYQFGRMPVTIYMDPNAKSRPGPGGPLILYYHATLSGPVEVLAGFGLANIQTVVSQGGVVAAFQSTACSFCTTTDDWYWYVEDDAIQDQVVACAIQQANIDTRHIHALGWSAGGLHTIHVGLARSNYMASVVSYSGGLPPWPGTAIAQDPTNHFAALLTYGGVLDDVVLNFNSQSKQYYSLFEPLGYYTMMCAHGGIHSIDGNVAPLTLKFFMDHPYRVSPEPYAAGVPSVYPAYCQNTPGG